MTTAQEVLADAIPPFPFFIENPVDLHRDDLPTNNATNSPTQPRDVQASAANVYLQDELRGANKDTDPLPDRCQFFFSDGRQCTMARSDIHPSLCRFHAEREEQLFGDPAPGGNVVGRALDLPELHSACRDLTTATGVNRALGQVFRLLAQRRISRQEAATFGHLAQLLLRTISLMRSSRESPAANVYLQDELRGLNKDHQELSRVNKVDAAFDDGVRADVILSEQRERRTSPNPTPAQEISLPSLPHHEPAPTVRRPPIPPAASSAARTAAESSLEMNTSTAFVSNSRIMNRSEFAKVKVTQNEHLHKSRPGGTTANAQQEQLRGVNKVGRAGDFQIPQD